MTRASIIHCQSYDRIAVREALLNTFENLGGIGRFVSAGDNILLKPNLICPKPATSAAQTNPAVICETARIIKAAGANVTVADSPAWSDTAGCLRALGIYEELLEMGINITNLDKPKTTQLPMTKIKIGLSSVALKADKIINLPKLKAHQQLTATIAVKNMFGAVVGKRKAIWHYRQGDSVEQFATMLLDIFLTLKPVINIVDGIVAMQGQGPINGSNKQISVLVGSEDAICCEAICAKIIGLQQNQLPILSAAKKLNIGCSDLEKIDLIGDKIQELICKDFQQAEPVPLKFTLPRVCKSIAKQLLIILRKKE